MTPTLKSFRWVYLGIACLALTFVVTLSSPQIWGNLTPTVGVQFTSYGQVLDFLSDGFYASDATYALHVTFAGAQLTPPSTVGTGSSPAALSRVTYSNLWNGISITYDADEAGILRSTYWLAPQVHANLIRLHYNQSLAIQADGTLAIRFAHGEIRESAPIAWQDVGGKRVNVPVAFEVLGTNDVGFALGEHDPSAAVTIDPLMTWSTFLGGTSQDQGSAIALDGNGNVYVSGFSESTWGSPIRAYASASFSDAFVAKLNSNGTLLWNTFLGGSGEDQGRGIAVDSNGNTYVAGTSDATWGAGDCTNCPLRPFSANSDAFVAKLNPNGALLWNTFLGGTGNDDADGITIDPNKNPLIAGTSSASWGSPVRAYTDLTDAFAAKLGANGALIWNTFLGASGADSGAAIAADKNGNALVAGTSGATWGTPVRAYSDIDDGFAAKLSSGGTLVWNTFLGGVISDEGKGISVDSAGNAYVVGDSDYTWGTPLHAFIGTGDAFAAKLNTNGGLVWNTFYGAKASGGFSYSGGISLDKDNNLLVTGYSYSSWGKPARPYIAQTDGFAAKLNSSGAMGWNTFLGGAGGDFGSGIAVDTNGNAVVVGFSGLGWGTPIRKFTNSSADVFVTKIPKSPACSGKPEVPILLAPGAKTKQKQVPLNWSDAACASSYDVVVKLNSKIGSTVFSAKGLKASNTKTSSLKIGSNYFWQVTAHNKKGTSVSPWQKFQVISSGGGCSPITAPGGCD